MDLLVQVLFGVVALGVLVGWTYRSAVRSRRDTLDARGRATLALIALTACGGALGSTGWLFDDPRSFSWDLPPLASRMLGVAGIAFAVLASHALRRPTWTRVSLVLLSLVVYLAPLAFAALFQHLARFDPRAPITYAFFAVVAVMTGGAVALLARPSRALVRAHEPDERPERATRFVLGAAATVLLPWGAALFVTQDGPSRLVWVWRTDLLSTRLIAAMWLTLGVTSSLSLRSRVRARMALAFLAVYGTGAALAAAANQAFGKPIPWGYVTVLGTLGAAAVSVQLWPRLEASRSPRTRPA